MTAKLHTSCSTLTLDKFITCACDGDLSVLVIEGQPDPEQLRLTWNELYTEYTDLIQDSETQYVQSLNRDILLLNHRLIIIHSAVEILRLNRVDELVKVLKKNGYNFQYNFHDPISYNKDLHAVMSRSKSLALELETKRLMYKRMTAGGGVTHVTRGYFDEVLVAVSKFMGMNIRENEVTVAKFAVMYRRLAESLQKQDDGRRSNK